MKAWRILSTLVCILCLSITIWLPPVSAQTWTQKGGTLSADPQGWAFQPSITIAADGTIYTIWSQHTTPGTQGLVAPRAAKWSGGTWQQLGGAIGHSTQPAQGASIAVVGTTPYAAWYESSGYGWSGGSTPTASSVFVAHWDGTQWAFDTNSANYNGALNTSVVYDHHARDPVVASISGVPYVSWIELRNSTSGPSYNVVVTKHLSAGQWIQDGSEFPSTDSASFINGIAAAGTTMPYIVWSQYRRVGSSTAINNGPGIVQVDVLSNGAWSALGSSLNILPSDFPGYVSIALIGATPYVAWQERTASGPNQLYVKHWNGTSWVQDGTGNLNFDPASGEAGRPSLGSDGTTLWLAWAEGVPGQKSQLYVRSLVNGTWSTPQGSLNIDAVNGSAQSAAIAASAGNAQVAWGETDYNSNTKQIYVKGTNAGTPAATTLSPWGTSTPPPTIPANTWVQLSAGGIAADGNVYDFAFDTFIYDPGLKKSIVMAAYHPYPEAENQNALLVYDFPRNRWDILDVTNAGSSEQLPGLGHDEGNAVIDPVHHMYITHGNATESHGMGFRTYIYDLNARRGKSMTPPTESPLTVNDASAFDSDDNLMLTIGSDANITSLYDPTGNQWTSVNSVPNAHNYTGLVYDPRHRVFVAFGGSYNFNNGMTTSSETWTFNPATRSWTHQFPPASPPNLRAPQMAFDSVNGVVLMTEGRPYGTSISSSNAPSTQTWAYDAGLNSWTLITSSMPAGCPRNGDSASLAYDSDDQIFLLRDWMGVRNICAFRYVPGPADALPPAKPQGLVLE